MRKVSIIITTQNRKKTGGGSLGSIKNPNYMTREINPKLYSLAKLTGFIFAYFISTTMLYFILVFLNKLPVLWTYFDIAKIMLGVAIIGLGLKRWLG